jgi:hypothetical protein
MKRQLTFAGRFKIKVKLEDHGHLSLQDLETIRLRIKDRMHKGSLLLVDGTAAVYEHLPVKKPEQLSIFGGVHV